MKKYPRFGRQFAKACGRFPMFSESDRLMVPADADYCHLALIAWMHKQAEKMKTSRYLRLVHFYSSAEPSSVTVDTLKAVSRKMNVPLFTRKVVSPKNVNEMKQILCGAAIDLGCNKIALPDSLDYIDACILCRMSCDGVFAVTSICESVNIGEKTVVFIRPFCFVTDDEIAKFATMNEFENKPTGIRVEEEDFMETARHAIHFLLDDSSNIRMNIFNSQFNIQKKFVGSGEDDPFTRDIQ